MPTVSNYVLEYVTYLHWLSLQTQLPLNYNINKCKLSYTKDVAMFTT